MTNAIVEQCNVLGMTTINNALTTLIGAHSDAETNALLYYNGKIVKTQDGKFYKVTVSPAGLFKPYKKWVVSGNDLFTLLGNACAATNQFKSGYTTPNNKSFDYSCTCQQYVVSCSEVTNLNVTARISTNRSKTTDALYDIVALPYGTPHVRTANYSSQFNVKESVSMAAVIALAKALGGGGTNSFIYDIQLLPYCPVQDMIADDNGDLLIKGTEHKNYDFIVDNSNSTNVGILYYVPKSDFTFDIAQELEIEKYQMITGFTDIDVLPYPYSSLKNNIDYVIATLDKPADLPWDSGQGSVSTRISSLKNGSISNNILFKKVNKKTGLIMDSVYASSLDVMFYQNSSIFGGAYMYITVKASSSGGYTPSGWSWSKSEYESADYYLDWLIDDTDSWGGRYISTGLAKISKIAIYDNTVSGSYAMKVDNECNLYRLVSPNYQGEFEFSLAKNGGIDKFNVDCTYKPFNPYIHVNPNFKNLYGQDFDDSRGLICQGDYTVGMISDAWTQYEMQNKNYQSIFNRQIQNMDVEQRYQRIEEYANGIAGIAKGAAIGAYGGGKIGNMAGGYGAQGAMLGGMLGTAFASGAEFLDVMLLNGRQTEAKSYAIDMYNYQLQNVKALPSSMTRCTALTHNNKLFPFVEIYSCTDEEKEALISKLKYDGMTINKIGQIQNYTDFGGRMVRGEVIRFDEADNKLKEDTHMANTIYEEIKKGVYI